MERAVKVLNCLSGNVEQRNFLVTQRADRIRVRYADTVNVGIALLLVEEQMASSFCSCTCVRTPDNLHPAEVQTLMFLCPR